MTSRIHLVDLRAQYLKYKAEFDDAVVRCLEATSFIGGSDHEAFTQEFSEYCGGGHTVLCGNGTDALCLAIIELLGPGDGKNEIITVSHTFLATAEAISWAGYKPVFVDIDPQTYLMDTAALASAITARTKALIPVHLYGQMAPMDKIVLTAQKHGLPVIEDAAQAHGAIWKDQGPGMWGEAACFSFYPGKNLGAWGDGGAVFTRHANLAEVMRTRANHGRKSKYRHEFPGVNSRLDGLQAAILRVKLRYLDEWNQRRRKIAAIYGELLADHSGIKLPCRDSNGEHVFHLYVIQLDNRDSILEKLNNSGIMAGIHYPVPVHAQPAYSHLGIHPEDLPVTHAVAKKIISLPIYPEMRNGQVEYVAKMLLRSLN